MAINATRHPHPFPDYEREVAADGTVYYTYTDHLGSVVAMSWLGGTYRDGSLARYDPFGNYRTWPGSNVNPLIL